MLRGYSQTVIDLRAIQMGHEHGVWGGDINEKYVVSGSGDRSVMVCICYSLVQIAWYWARYSTHHTVSSISNRS